MKWASKVAVLAVVAYVVFIVLAAAISPRQCSDIAFVALAGVLALLYLTGLVVESFNKRRKK